MTTKTPKSKTPQIKTALSTEEALQRLEEGIAKAGGVQEYADLCGCSAGFISHVRVGRRPLNDTVLKPLGIRRETIYVRSGSGK